MKVEPGIVEFDTTHHNTRVVSCFLCLISSFAIFEFDKRHLFDLFDILALLVATDLATWIIITLILLTTVMVTSPFLHGLPSLKLTVRTWKYGVPKGRSFSNHPFSGATVDASEILRSPVDMVNIPLQGFSSIPGSWPWDFWTINSILVSGRVLPRGVALLPRHRWASGWFTATEVGGEPWPRETWPWMTRWDQLIHLGESNNANVWWFWTNFLKIFWNFHPEPWGGDEAKLTSIFFKWVGSTTN